MTKSASPLLKLASLQRERNEARAQVAELREKLSAYEKREEAERLLVEATEAEASSPLKVTGVEDFLTKRAQIEKHDLETVKLAMAMADKKDFGIGEPEDESPLFQSSGSKADDMFTHWLASSGT